MTNQNTLAVIFHWYYYPPSSFKLIYIYRSERVWAKQRTKFSSSSDCVFETHTNRISLWRFLISKARETNRCQLKYRLKNFSFDQNIDESNEYNKRWQNTYISIDSIFGSLALFFSHTHTHILFLLSLCGSHNTLLTDVYIYIFLLLNNKLRNILDKKVLMRARVLLYTHTVLTMCDCVLDPFACHEYKSISTQSKQ